MRIPQLYLGLIGFDANAERVVRQFLLDHAKQTQAEKGTAPGRQVMWSIADFREADALLIYGATAIAGAGDHVRFQSPQFEMSHQAPLGVQISDIAQPFAISHPAHLKELGVDVKSYPVFDLRVPASLPMTLRQFEAVLRPLRNLYTLAVELTIRREKLQPQYTYHLESKGRVDAIIDMTERVVMLRPGTRTADLTAATWLKRPASANYAPEHFLRCALAELTWLFAMHCKEPDLPRRYLTKPIYLHALPNIRSSLLYPRHALLLDELAANPHTIDELGVSLPHHARWMMRDIYALFLLRAISTSGPIDDPLAVPSIPNETDGDARYLLNRMGHHLQTMRAGLGPLDLGEKSFTPE
jgi:hypothetical protein